MHTILHVVKVRTFITKDGSFHDQFVKANPKSKRVKTHEGKIFPSLSEAGRYYGFVGITGPRARIANGTWKHL
jgi:hypothetical protein